MDSLCNEQYSTITQPEALTYFPFSLYELSSVGKIDLKITSFIDFAGGYSRHGRDLIEYLVNTGLFNVRLEKLKSNVDVDPFTYNYFKHLTRTEINEENFIEIVIGAPGHLERLKNSKAKYKIGYTMGETYYIADKFIDMCKHCDELFVPTNSDVFRFGELKGYLKITKMPLWVDTKRYTSSVKKAMITNLPENNFVFMFVGSWNKRKGVHEIIEAFTKEFSSKENVSLVMLSRYAVTPFNDVVRKRHKKDHNKWNILWEYNYVLKKSSLDKKEDKPHVCILDVPIDESIMPNFMRNANVCIGASRGESTWLPGLEFGSMGITSIQMNWGGHTNYLNELNSYPIDIDGLEKCDNELYYGVSDYYDEHSEMAVISIENIQRQMRNAFESKFYTDRKGLKLKKLVRTEYNKEKRLEEVKKRLMEISEEIK